MHVTETTQVQLPTEVQARKELTVADILSRARTSDTNSSTEEDVMKHVDKVVKNILVPGNRVQDIKINYSKQQGILSATKHYA